MTNRIAKALGVTPAGLRHLIAADESETGLALQGSNGEYANGGARIRLMDQGYIENRPIRLAAVDTMLPYITDAGRDIVRRAKEMGI